VALKHHDDNIVCHASSWQSSNDEYWLRLPEFKPTYSRCGWGCPDWHILLSFLSGFCIVKLVLILNIAAILLVRQ